jgi:hypothetical protein
MNKEQTPIEWLEEHIKKVNWIDKKLSERMDIIKQAKEMDKKRMDELKDFETWKEWKNKPENK